MGSMPRILILKLRMTKKIFFFTLSTFLLETKMLGIKYGGRRNRKKKFIQLTFYFYFFLQNN